MKRCPSCGAGLGREDYEGVEVFRCPDCRGVLLPRYRLDLIRHRRHRSPEDLKAQAVAEFRSDTKREVRCPRCGALMAKRPFASRYMPLSIDVCRACDYVWLDAGELELLQLLYEASASGHEVVEMQKRMRELQCTPERKARFEAALAQLSEEGPRDSEAATDQLALELIKLLLRAGKPML
ncbi:MAG: zf-TFIIB domain-containing protein [Verrucomicrobiota bacterium]